MPSRTRSRLTELVDRVCGRCRHPRLGRTIAERAVALGGVALGSVRAAARSSRMQEYPLDISGGGQHVEALSSALAIFGRSVRAGIDTAGEMGDADTADLFTEVSRGIDKLLWFVEAHAQQ